MANSAYQFEGSFIHDALVNKLKRVLTSAVLLLAAYMTTKLLVQGYIFVVSWLLGYDTAFGYHWVVVKPFEYMYWGSIRVVLIYAVPPLLCLAATYVVQFLVISKTAAASVKKMYFFWLQTCMINFLLTQLFIMPVGVSGAMTGLYQTLSIVATWFGATGSIFIPATVIAGAGAILWGLMTAPVMQSFSFSARMISYTKGKDAIVRQVFLFPLIIASPFIAFFSNQYSFLAHVISLALLALVFIGTILRHRTDTSVVLCSREDVLNIWPWREFLITAAMWAVVIVLFNK